MILQFLRELGINFIMDPRTPRKRRDTYPARDAVTPMINIPIEIKVGVPYL